MLKIVCVGFFIVGLFIELIVLFLNLNLNKFFWVYGIKCYICNDIMEGKLNKWEEWVFWYLYYYGVMW